MSGTTKNGRTIALKSLGILVGGGDCPGLNALLRAVVHRSARAGVNVYGIEDGWLGLTDILLRPITTPDVRRLQIRGGTLLGTSRTNPVLDQEKLRTLLLNWQRLGLSALIVAGGNGTLSGALRMWRDHGLPIIGIPTTIDNDIPLTDYTLGFHTAVSIATDIIDRLHTTAEARRHVIVTEVMGGNSGWIATYAGMAGGANAILIPEFPFRLSELCSRISHLKDKGITHSFIVVAEAAMPHHEENFLTPEQERRARQHSHLAGIGTLIAREIERTMKVITRVCVLGPVVMAGSPHAYDRVLGSRFGMYAVEMALEGKFGCMVSLQGEHITSVPLEDVADKVRSVPEKVYRGCEPFFVG